MTFRNFYKCDRCSFEWDSVWQATCDDRCGECGLRNVAPYVSEDENGPPPTLLDLFSAAERKLSDAIAAVGAITTHAVLRHNDGRSWQFILPDLDVKTRWRAQRFDVNGFSGHSVYSSLGLLLEDVIRQGYVARDDQALERVQAMPSFQRGNFVADLLRQVDGQQLTMACASSKLRAYDQAFKSKQVRGS